MKEKYLSGDQAPAPEAATPYDAAVLAHNAQLLRWMVNAWLPAVASQRLRPGSLGSTPAALLVAAHNQLGYHPGNDVLAQADGSPHEEAYTWWTSVHEHGSAHRLHKVVDKRHEAKGLLFQFPIPLWLLYELDTAFDTLYPSHNQDQNKLEVMFEPGITGSRLIKAVETVITHLPVTADTLQQLLQKIITACQ